jgi:hypothetical protein
VSLSHLSDGATSLHATGLRVITSPFISACERFEGLPSSTVIAVLGGLLLVLAIGDAVARRWNA